MSQFHFPKLHFSGNAIIDPATGNNNYHFPLVCYEPITGTAVIPPRIYISHSEKRRLKKDLADKAIPIEEDEDGDEYISIIPIRSEKLFKKWMTTPLGSCSHDSRFHWLYEKVLTEKEGKKLTSLHPGYWNYYGTMNFTFDKVNIHSIETDSDLFRIDNRNSALFPQEIKQILDAEVFFLNDLQKKNAVMIDVTATMSIFTQIFADRLVVQKDDIVILSSKPYKASLRQITPTRVIGKVGIFSSSGTFYTSILFGHSASLIRNFFESNFPGDRTMVGVGIRFDLFGLEEDQYPDYATLEANSNPAKIKVLGTLYPLLEGELRSANTDRLLIPSKSYDNGKKFGSVPFCFDNEDGRLCLDFVGSWPVIENGKLFEEFFDQIKVNAVSPDKRKTLASTNIDKSLITWDYFFNHGGIIDLKMPDLLDFDQVYNFSLDVVIKGLEVSVLEEIALRIISDQTGIYREENHVSKKFLNNDGNGEDCRLLVIERGKAKLEHIEVSVLLVEVLNHSKGTRTEILQEIRISNGSIFTPSEDKAGHYFYCFYPLGNYLLSSEPVTYMLQTSSYVNLRIIPAFNQVYQEVSFDILYEQLLKDYDLIYPSSGIITPFTSSHFSSIYKFLHKIMKQDAWGNYLYMPSSRDMSDGKRKLLFKYLEQASKRTKDQ